MHLSAINQFDITTKRLSVDKKTVVSTYRFYSDWHREKSEVMSTIQIKCHLKSAVVC